MGMNGQLNLDFGNKFASLPDDKKWQVVCEHLASKGLDSSLEVWLRQIKPLSLSGDKFVFAASSSFAKEWIEKRYLSLLKETLSQFEGNEVEVELRVVPEKRDKEKTPSKRKTQTGLPLNPRYTFETFVVGPSNRFAYSSAKAVSASPGSSYNPLFIYGGVGLGKTHLMQAIGNSILENFDANVMYVSGEYFTTQYIEALKDGKISSFRKKFRSVDIWLLDDIQFIADKERTTEEFFHTFNTLYEMGKQIVICSDRAPSQLQLFHPRVRSRLESGVIAGIRPPDFETRLAILEKKLEMEKASLPQEVLLYIAKVIQSNIRALEGALVKLLAWTSINNTLPSLPLAQEVIEDYIEKKEAKANVGIQDIISAISKYFGISPRTLRGKRKDKKVLLPRQICMYLCRELTPASVTEIAKVLGRTHPAVLNGYNRIKEQIERDKELASIIQKIISLLPSPFEVR